MPPGYPYDNKNKKAREINIELPKPGQGDYFTQNEGDKIESMVTYNPSMTAIKKTRRA
jgi:hypothetical protein